MQNRSKFHTAVVLASIAVLSLGSEIAAAQHGGGGGGGGHGGGGGGHGGGGAVHASAGGGYRGGGIGGSYHGGGYAGGGGYRGGGGYHGGGYGYGGYRGGYGGGYRGGYYGGYRGGYGYGGYYGYGGWGFGLAAGLYFATLPLYYSTWYWGGVPYYYANDTYYVYSGSAGQYQTVAPPAELASQVSAQQPAVTELIAYPKNGQSTEQQAKDKFECHRWASTQTGFDPTQGAPAAGAVNKRSDYLRAQAACLDGRGYSVN